MLKSHDNKKHSYKKSESQQLAEDLKNNYEDKAIINGKEKPTPTPDEENDIFEGNLVTQRTNKTHDFLLEKNTGKKNSKMIYLRQISTTKIKIRFIIKTTTKVFLRKK